MEQQTKAQIISGAVCGMLMLICLIVYLILGVTINFWHPGWLIPACGGLTCGIIGCLTSTISNLKKLNSKQNDK